MDDPENSLTLKMLTSVENLNVENFLITDPTKNDELFGLLGNVYKLTVDLEDKDNMQDVLEDLVIEDMDEEQIWQQIELLNAFNCENLMKKYGDLVKYKERSLEISLKEENSLNLLPKKTKVQIDKSNDKDIAHNTTTSKQVTTKVKESSKKVKKPTKNKKGSSGVEDDFFKLNEMEEFLLAEEAKEELKTRNGFDKNAIDYFADDFDSADIEDGNLNYSEFYNDDPEKEESPTINEEQNESDNELQNAYEEDDDDDEDNDDDEDDDDDEEDDDDDNDFEDEQEKETRDIDDSIKSKSALLPDSENTESNAAPSSFQISQTRMRNIMNQYEEIILGEKPWQMVGEVVGTKRPKNSLLEELLEFDPTMRPPPVVTEKTTLCLESIIKQRIKDEAWDDVVRVVKPQNNNDEYKKKLILDSEKPKQSLSQIYENQYKTDLQKQSKEDESSEPIPKEHQEIKIMLRNLFSKLDSISNFHFAPQHISSEIKIIKNSTATEKEEIAPVAVNSENLLAPEEIFRKSKHEILGKTERSATDKSRSVRKKKNKLRNSSKVSKEQELKNKTKKVATLKTTSGEKSLKSSKAFFAKLQETS